MKPDVVVRFSWKCTGCGVSGRVSGLGRQRLPTLLKKIRSAHEVKSPKCKRLKLEF